ncbi:MULTISPECIES: N-acetyltransferase [unclassified Novosphingobium]|uniref:GNAT family N-acetyltransferase n=1 Tax=unclassified Novosphingobium TaxID=2644732 RepID=UPI000EE7D3A3|nr:MULTISPECIES: N-acetyltransferase [unclassified Novosphingobium]HCF24497.1 GNAT family N-acetyltransferase [Novosphingobium sp.]HQV04309.1 N-acetyltransferase [Novosphingobium sp.]
MTEFTIRPEVPGDEAAIHELVKCAFAPMPFSEGDEQDLVDALRGDGDLVHSLVAVDPAGTIIGHISFSPVTIDAQASGWFQMAPVSVSPEVQRTGIGSALIETGIARLRADGAAGVAVVGNPAYYERFGFRVFEGLAPASEHDAPYFRAMVLAGSAPRGILRYARAFG